MSNDIPLEKIERLREKQRHYQSIRNKYTHLRYPSDKITSVAIPGALIATCMFLMGRGIYNMAHGIGKIE